MIEVKAVNNELDRSLLEIYAGETHIANVLSIFYKKYLSLPLFFDNLEDARSWFFAKEKKRAKSYAIYLLSKRSYHSAQLKLKLESKLISQRTIKFVLEEIKGYLDDDAWARNKVEKEFARGYGPKALLAKFMRSGVFIESELIESIVTKDRQKQIIFSIIKKLFSRSGVDQKKALLYLTRRGFDYQLSKEVLTRFRLKNIPQESEL